MASIRRWCRRCEQLESAYVEAAARAKQLNLPVQFASVESSKNKELMDRFAIYGFPTLQFFRGGVEDSFTPARDADALLAEARKASAFQLPQLRTQAELSAFAATGQQAILLGVFRPPLNGSNSWLHAFREAAYQLDQQPLRFVFSVLKGRDTCAAPIDPITSQILHSLCQDDADACTSALMHAVLPSLPIWPTEGASLCRACCC